MPGKWHTEWQSYFVNKEQTISNELFTTPSKTRRADVLLKNYVIEFQHSLISEKEIEARKKDWECVDKKIIWVIDGNETCTVKPKTNNSNIITVEFEWWKANNFKCYDIIFFDIDGMIYTIEPKHIKSNVVQTSNPILKREFIEMLKQDNMEIIDTLNDKYIDHRPSIHIKQEGAGNGKTYGIIQLLENDNYQHYNTFVYLTKQHSAVNVIKQELNDQQSRGILPNINIIGKPIIDNKKHIIRYHNTEDEQEKKIIIGTIDSFKWALGDKTITGIDKFRTLVNDIIENDIRAGKDGYIYYTKTGVKLNMTTLIIGDELQDLHPEYAKALIKIAKEKYIDFYAVGDKLQSISNEKNAFTYLTDELEEDDTIKVIKHPFKNICRRFNDGKLVNFVNECVPFDKYSLPPIENGEKESDEKSVEFIEGVWIDPNKPMEDHVNKEANNIMQKYIYEVDKYNRSPKDFLIVTPFVNKNPILDEVNSKIREFWRKKYNDDDTYTKYSIFHKSEEGTSIDLSQSEEFTRIVSIHSSKGDGRPVVFIVGLTESALMKWTSDNDSLIFNSLLHVAITRQKEKLYVRYENHNDKINKLIDKYRNQYDITRKPIFQKTINVKLKDLLLHDRDNNFKIVNDNIINHKKPGEPTENIDGPKMIIDMQHHCIRYNSFSILIQLHLLGHKIKTKNNQSSQPLYQILKKIQKYSIEDVDICEYYRYIRDNIPNKKGIFPVIQHSKGKYKQYYDFFKILIDKIKIFISCFLKTGDINTIDTEWIELVCLYYLIDVHENGAYCNVSVDDMYDLIDLHKKCSSKEKDIYIEDHYEKIKYTQKIVDRFTEKYPDLTYLISHRVYYDGNNKDFSIYNKFEIIGYNESEVVIIEIKPQFNSLNFNDIIYDSIFKTFLITNSSKKDEETYIDNKLLNKKIKTVVLTYDNDYTPYYIEWNNLIQDNNKLILDIYKQNMVAYFQLEHTKLYNYFVYYKYGNDKQNDHELQDKNFMSRLISDYSSMGKLCYSYALYVFKNIEEKLDDDEMSIEDITKDYFTEYILKKLKKSVNNFYKL